MKNYTKIILPCLTALALTACVTTGWNATRHTDEFTGTKMCRVERGTESERDFARGFTGIYYTQHFYAENHNGQVRAGIRTEPPLPIGGDVQIKVGGKLYTLTSADTPLDVAPTIPTNTDAARKAMGNAYADTLDNMTKDIQRLSSPYRAFTGKKALALLRDMANTSEEIKFRVVGVNSTISGTGSFKTGSDFAASLNSCGIKL
ncbi:MAG: hypothetical protein J0L77_06375 [Alphaproteobacteria bacterium]|nr:hypothetical protein [Alphaproteobacteria bacterium]